MNDIGVALSIAIEALKEHAEGCKDRALVARIDSVRGQLEELHSYLVGNQTTGVLRLAPEDGGKD